MQIVSIAGQQNYVLLRKPFLRKLFNSKRRRMARWTAILLFACCLHVSAHTYSQKITLKAKNKPLTTVLMAIQKQSGYNIIGRTELLKDAHPVSIDIRNMPIDKALAVCFKDQPVTYVIKDKAIILKEKPIVNTQQRPPKQKGALYSIAIKDTIRGFVRDSLGNPIPNVSVMEKGTANGTMTDDNGKFTFPTESLEVTLVFKYVGFNEKELVVQGDAVVNVIMQAGHNILDAIQTIAYGTSTKRFNTGAVSTITAEDIAKQPVNNPLAALEGRVPGLVITQTTGNSNGAFRVRLRGQNSIANGNDPLFVIDGVPYTSTSINSTIIGPILAGGSPLSSISPGEIESITVLKDADATAIYGSRGANGVILITTKKGKAGKTQVYINYYSGVAKLGHKIDLLNTQQYLEMRHEAFKNDDAQPAFYDRDVNGNWDTTRYTDWQKKLIGSTANINDITTSISGGNQQTQFLISGNYHRESTVYPGDFSDKKASVHFNLTNKSLNDKFRTLLSVGYTSDADNTPSQDLSFPAVILPPDAPAVYDSLGKLNWPAGFNNPYAQIFQRYTSATHNLVSNLVLSCQILRDIQLKVSGGYVNLDMNERQINPEASLYPNIGLQRSAIFGTSNFQSWIIEPQAQYKKRLNKGNLDILIGTSFQETNRKNQTLDATGYSSDALLDDIAGATIISKDLATPPFDIKYRYQAVFGRINYNLEDKYIINLTGRRDGSSRFGNGKQFANFGAFGAAWIFTQENLLKNHFSVLSYGKLRASYGITGNDQINDYGYLSTYSPTTYSYQGDGGLIPSRLANPEYGWETNKKLEAALELGFIKDRILFSIDYFRNRSSNQLVGYSLPYITGFNTIQYNLPAIVQNTGLEIELNTQNMASKTFQWTSSFNITIPRNKLVSYPGIEKSSYANKYVVGKSLQIYKSFHSEGVDPQTGIYIFQDVVNGGNTANPYSPNDLLGLKTIGQKFYGGFDNTFVYKGWELSFFFQFIKQTGFAYLYGGFDAPGMISNQPDIVLDDRWQKPDDKASIQRFTQNYGSEAYLSYINAIFYGDNAVTDASFIRLKNLSLSYNLPSNWLNKVHLQTCRLYLQGQNLFTFTNYIGLDPENQDISKLPPLRVITGGIKLTF